MNKKIIEGYCCVGGLMGVSIHKKLKKWVNIEDDIFTLEMLEFKDKKIRITIEELNDVDQKGDVA